MKKLNNEYNIFSIDFITTEDIKGSISMATAIGEMILHIGGFSATLCNVEDFFHLIDGVEEVEDLIIGKKINIDDVEVKIIDIDLETIEEYNRECERIEWEDIMFLED